MTDSARVAHDEAEASSGLIGNLPMILWQRRWLVIVPAVIIAVAAVLAAYLLPRTYESKATLLVESSDLPGGGAGDDDPIDRRMAKIRQQILSRPDLVELIQANDLYNASNHSEPLSKLVDRMRDATELTAIDADIQRAGGSRNNNGSIAFTLAFSYPRPAQAQLVAQTFVDRLLKLSATSSLESAQTTVAFLEDQESALQTQVQGIESQINRIAGVNGAALSAASLAMVGNVSNIDYSSQIAAIQRQNTDLQAQLQSGLAVERDPAVTAAEATLAAVKAQYSDDHPDVKLAESRLAAARANSKSYQSRGVSGLVTQQIAANNRAIADLEQQRASDRSKAAAMAAAQSKGPEIAQQVQQLQGRADIIRANLAKVSSSLLTARSMVKLADQQRGERLMLIDPPVTPDRPSSPNRPLLVAGGILGGIAAGIALAMLIELIVRPIRSANQLAGLLGEGPLAVVPVLSGRRKRRWSLGFRRKARAV